MGSSLNGALAFNLGDKLANAPAWIIPWAVVMLVAWGLGGLLPRKVFIPLFLILCWASLRFGDDIATFVGGLFS